MRMGIGWALIGLTMSGEICKLSVTIILDHIGSMRCLCSAASKKNIKIIRACKNSSSIEDRHLFCVTLSPSHPVPPGLSESPALTLRSALTHDAHIDRSIMDQKLFAIILVKSIANSEVIVGSMEELYYSLWLDKGIWQSQACCTQESTRGLCKWH